MAAARSYRGAPLGRLGAPRNGDRSEPKCDGCQRFELALGDEERRGFEDSLHLDDAERTSGNGLASSAQPASALCARFVGTEVGMTQVASLLTDSSWPGACSLTEDRLAAHVVAEPRR
jgi:hypothetical protein